MNDIAFDNESYVWSPIANFEGIFDGRSHTISGLTAPMFDIVRGTICNLKLDANVEAALSANVGRGLLVNRFIGTMDNVEVSGSINITGSTADYAAVGGVIGKIYGESTITNVVNKAAVSALGTKRTYLGGIAGSTRYDTGSTATTTVLSHQPRAVQTVVVWVVSWVQVYLVSLSLCTLVAIAEPLFVTQRPLTSI